jgi:hypothetical protein
MKQRLKKKAEGSSDFPILLILLILAAVILFIVLWPMIKANFNSFLEILGIAQEKDTFIRSFEVGQGLEGALVFRYRFINDQLIAGYEINSTTSTGDMTLGAIYLIKEERVIGGMFDETQRKDYLLNGKEISYTQPAPSALDVKKYTLYALDSSGRVLQKKTVDWAGVFENQEKYLAQITVFMDFAEGLKGLSADTTGNLIFSKDIVMLGFNKDFNNGACAYKKFTWFLNIFSCSNVDVAMPKECVGMKSCLCLCRRVSNIEEYCGSKGRICYGYDEFDFIGGSRRTCGIEGWFGRDKGKNGEDNNPITIWKGGAFEDPNEEFNSLAIVINDDSESQLSLKLSPQTVSLVPKGSAKGEDIDVNRLIISK